MIGLTQSVIRIHLHVTRCRRVRSPPLAPLRAIHSGCRHLHDGIRRCSLRSRLCGRSDGIRRSSTEQGGDGRQLRGLLSSDAIRRCSHRRGRRALRSSWRGAGRVHSSQPIYPQAGQHLLLLTPVLLLVLGVLGSDLGGCAFHLLGHRSVGALHSRLSQTERDYPRLSQEWQHTDCVLSLE